MVFAVELYGIQQAIVIKYRAEVGNKLFLHIYSEAFFLTENCDDPLLNFLKIE